VIPAEADVGDGACLGAALWALALLLAQPRATSPEQRASRLILTAIALIGVGLALDLMLRPTAMPDATRRRGVLGFLSVALGLLFWADEVQYPGTMRALGVVGLGLAASVAGLALLTRSPFQLSTQTVGVGVLLGLGLTLFYAALRIGRRLRGKPPL
jgi:hypothetical protein